MHCECCQHKKIKEACEKVQAHEKAQARDLPYLISLYDK